MFRTSRVLLLTALIALAPLGAATAQTQRTALELAGAVERRAGATDFAQLEAFGLAAMNRDDREGLNRLYHVTWTFLNQGEFDKATLWNQRLATAARAQKDQRYIDIAHLNELTVRYDQGETAIAQEMARITRTATDWFVKAHATRLTALTLMDEGKVGEGLNLLAEMDARVPDGPFADTAHAGLWEMVGMGLMALHDLNGAADAFGRFEIDYARADYPRPDFDSLYNLTSMAVEVGDADLAAKLYAAHHRLAVRTGIEGLIVYDANLCARVAEARSDPRGVLTCLAPYGADLGAASFLADQLLPMRAVAYAQTGQAAAARRDLADIRNLIAEDAAREETVGEVARVEAELLFAQWRRAEAFEKLRAYHRDEAMRSARTFSDGIGQVTGDMQAQLAERRRQLEIAQANVKLNQEVISNQRWVSGIAVAFVLSALAALAWLWRSAGHLRVARRRAEEANRSKTEFLANMSHEIRTPLNGVVAMADALARVDTLKPREHEMVEVIRSSGVTLERLLSDILDSAKIESGQVTIEPAPFHLGQLAHDVAVLWEPKAHEKGVALNLRLDPSLDRGFQGDMVRIRQVLTNLVSNAVKFTAKGAVTVRIEPVGDDRIRFAVTDSGVGFDGAQKDRIFGRFLQADGSITRRYGGTGLGLSISRDLVALMGGTLECESKVGEGARFWFDVPLEPVDLAPDAASEAAAALDERPLRVLLADDHPANRKVIEVLLTGQPIELVSVVDGRKAVEAYEAGAFDLVLMDMQMPVLDGLAATREIRELETTRGLKRTPIVMLTANAMAEHVEAGRLAGADGHLAKPITTQTLFEGMARALEPQASVAQAA